MYDLARNLSGLPGVRLDSRSGPAGVTAYQQTCLKLKNELALPWLKSYCDMEPDLYASLLYEECKLATCDVDVRPAEDTASPQLSRVAEIALEKLLSIVHSGITFECTLDLIAAWLDDIEYQDNQVSVLPAGVY